jgi:inner membrane protein
MPSIFGHGLFAGAFASACTSGKSLRKTILLAVLCAILPDADVVAFNFDIPYGHMLGHRGFTHSFFFALLIGFAITLLFYSNLKKYNWRWWFMVLLFFICTASHGLFDAMTTGGLGVAFFAPFDAERYFFPFRPIQVSPIGIKDFFTAWGWRVIQSEVVWIGIPSLLIWGIGRIVHKK